MFSTKESLLQRLHAFRPLLCQATPWWNAQTLRRQQRILAHPSDPDLFPTAVTNGQWVSALLQHFFTWSLQRSLRDRLEASIFFGTEKHFESLGVALLWWLITSMLCYNSHWLYIPVPLRNGSVNPKTLVPAPASHAFAAPSTMVAWPPGELAGVWSTNSTRANKRYPKKNSANPWFL